MRVTWAPETGWPVSLVMVRMVCGAGGRVCAVADAARSSVANCNRNFLMRLSHPTLAASCLLFCGFVVVHFPAEVADGGFVHRVCGLGEVGGDMMLESSFADVAQKLLHFGNADDAGSAEGFERVLGKLAFPDVAANFSGELVGGEAAVGHGSGFDATDDGAVGVLFADGAGDDLLVVHDYVGEEVPGQVGA